MYRRHIKRSYGGRGRITLTKPELSLTAKITRIDISQIFPGDINQGIYFPAEWEACPAFYSLERNDRWRHLRLSDESQETRSSISSSLSLRPE